ncbi:aliphatic sulfonate ABC transporter permease SsuC [Agrobacterium sp. SHOUNA12C]|uniref:Aliphatic sulphonate ABC transporter n=2 Tax=Rhizobium rhizogenes TaxID=359 RepID=B9JG06_RHIR8|nr:aliphatic sulfonate ABC transporter permease SsuC [Rhizobium rhizogenes]ACM26846.1 aliphatic sulphonate ABC transporter [Rhizobium rhizogenes K84]KAA6489844.1 aliphatic sulfonate ABC transporter permease SsuC [Agrobacterium sp. ICMP 7243]MCJ9724336.1 aliphatic sulfonate ABC transporter permease SsuC [Agrobacterium sp. BETTINA12B]MCJ9761067.1 aliphatic sulfonate ABC transporter permease SsuC [Agrobacterium sp. SHOUNA12C]OCJ05878.1 ABC transporter permease [Agrobacterium sp. 13-626]OCJ25914.
MSTFDTSFVRVTAQSRARPAKQARPVISLERFLPFLLPAVVIAAWQLGSSVGWISTRIMPSPAAVVLAFWQTTISGQLPHNILVSAGRAFAGLLVGGSIGFLLGIANGVSRLSEKLTDTTLQMLRTIPHLAMVPLVILWFGIGEESKLFLTALGVLFPIYLNTYHGVRNVDRGLIEMGRVYGMSNWTLFKKVIFPGALPSILVGLRFALGIMWLTLIVAESIAASSGIGYMANNAREFGMTDVVVLTLVIYAVLGKLADVVARALERRALRWNPAYQN